MGATGEHIKPTDKGLGNRIRYAMEMKLWKKERINFHRERMEILLDPATDTTGTDWNAVLEDHLIKTAQFQHERLAHLIVTMSVGLMTVITVCTAVAMLSKVLAVLALFLSLLLGPYLLYYFMLENNVMAMYPIYDEILEKTRTQMEEKG